MSGRRGTEARLHNQPSDHPVLGGQIMPGVDRSSAPQGTLPRGTNSSYWCPTSDTPPLHCLPSCTQPSTNSCDHSCDHLSPGSLWRKSLPHWSSCSAAVCSTVSDPNASSLKCPKWPSFHLPLSCSLPQGPPMARGQRSMLSRTFPSQ